MQSQLTGFTDASRTASGEPSSSTATGGTETVFKGSINGDLLETIARHVTGVFEHMHITITESELTLHPYKTGEPDTDVLAQTVTLSIEDWESFQFNMDGEYVGLLKPHEGLYKAFAGNTVDGAVSVEITSCGPTSESWGAVTEHPLAEGNGDDGPDTPCSLDTLTVRETSSPVLRNPNHDPLTMDPLSYHTDLTLDGAYDVKEWLRESGGHDEDTVVLITASAGSRVHETRAGEYVLSFTEVLVDSWDVCRDSLVLTGSEMSRTDSYPDISDVRVGGTTSWPTGTTRDTIPDEHREAATVCWGFYQPDILHGMFKHLLKDTLSNGEFVFKMSETFPLEITHELSTSVETETNATLSNTLAPVVSPN